MAISVDELYSPVTLFASYKFSVANFTHTLGQRQGGRGTGTEPQWAMGNNKVARVERGSLLPDVVLSGGPCFRFVLTFVCHSCQTKFHYESLLIVLCNVGLWVYQGHAQPFYRSGASQVACHAATAWPPPVRIHKINITIFALSVPVPDPLPGPVIRGEIISESIFQNEIFLRLFAKTNVWSGRPCLGSSWPVL